MANFKVERGTVTTVTIDRKQVANSLNQESWRELYEVLISLSLDKAVKVIILTGDGEKAFCAGSDIAEMVGLPGWESVCFDEICHRVHLEILRMPKPVIAALNGTALGGGCTIAAACDFRIACDTIKMGLPEVNLGIIPGAGGVDIVVKLIGLSAVREMLFTGSIIDAKRALELGLVDRVVPREQFQATIDELAQKLAEKSTASLAFAKMAIGRASGLISESSIPYDTLGFSLCSTTDEKKVLMDKFLSKKK